MDEVRKEGVNLIYKDDKISVIGSSFKLEGNLPTAELTKIYMGGKGRTVATLTIESKKEEKAPEKTEEKPVKKLTINALIDELAAKGMSEEEIMKTEVIV